MKPTHFYILSFFLVSLLSFIRCDDSKTVQIFVPNGAIVGEKYSVQGKNIFRFLGIPYAQPPLGKLRFRKPVPAVKHVESLLALDWPKNCIQYLTMNSTDFYRSKNMSEDCLYLNIWSPGVNVDETHQRPVIIFIHGGSFLIGSSSFELYNGEIVSALADAVVVTIQYRLSTLGFLYTDQIENVTGNQGLWDQAMAIKWVHDNIRYFGGNSKQITLMGNSAGAWSVSLHLLSPITRDLFQNAILLSGAAMNNLVSEPQEIISRMLIGIRLVGCASQNDTQINQQVLECLENLDANIVDKIWHSTNNFKLYDIPQLVTIDGEFLPSKPDEMLKKGNHKQNFNLLLSTVEDEGSFILETIPSSGQFLRNDPEPITLVEAKQFLNNLLNEVLKAEVENNTVNKIYFGGLNKNFDNQNLFRKQVAVAYGDLVITCPAIEFAKKVFKSSPKTISVYQWYYNAKIGKEKFQCSKWMGTCHCSELYPVFGIPFQNTTLYHNREREISNEIINVIKSFIRKGKPGEDQSEWLSYFIANEGRSVVAPYYEISNELKSYKSFKYNLKQTTCDVLWNKYFTR